MKTQKHKNVLANRFSALDVFWKRKQEREGEYGMDDERQKEVFGLIRHPVWCPGFGPRGMRSDLALQHVHRERSPNVRCISDLSGNVSSCNCSTWS